MSNIRSAHNGKGCSNFQNGLRRFVSTDDFHSFTAATLYPLTTNVPRTCSSLPLDRIAWTTSLPMKALLVVIFLSCTCLPLFGQQKLSVALDDSGRRWMMSMVKEYDRRIDSIVIDLSLTNGTSRKYFLVDLDTSEIIPTYDSTFGEVYLNYGGVFEPQLNLVNRLRVWKPGQTIHLKLSVDMKKVARITRDICHFFVLIGYFEYNPSLAYLSGAGPEYLRTKSESDLHRITSLHRELFLGSLPIQVGHTR